VRAAAMSPEEQVEMPAPTADRGALEQGIRLGLRRLFRRSDVAGRTARRLTFAITLEDGRTWERTVTFREPTADADTVLFVLRSHLDRLDLPAAATTLTLRLHDLGGEHGRQERLF